MGAQRVRPELGQPAGRFRAGEPAGGAAQCGYDLGRVHGRGTSQVESVGSGDFHWSHTATIGAGPVRHTGALGPLEP